MTFYHLQVLTAKEYLHGFNLAASDLIFEFATSLISSCHTEVVTLLYFKNILNISLKGCHPLRAGGQGADGQARVEALQRQRLGTRQLRLGLAQDPGGGNKHGGPLWP